ncbi:MAG: YsnF/AvaK domain-containing protein [Acidobacteriota bacterium]|nr:YsnF/AvaK domain-containing protein [Acidobacteriota bacterium]
MDQQAKIEDVEELADITVIPVVAEELSVHAESVKTGAVRVHKRVQERVEHIDMPVLHDTVDVRRVVLNRVVDTAPRVRREGDTIIVPVVEEEIVVTKRLILKEEYHLVHKRTQTRATRDVIVRREEATVERVDAKGQVVPGSVVRRRNKVIPED